MASHSNGLFRFSAKTVGQVQLATLAVAGVMAVATVADPIEVALVESVSNNSLGVEFMDYLQAGQIIRLGPRDTIVLTYLSSCLQETITGGTVTVGTDWSEVQSGEVRRMRGQCDVGKTVLTGAQRHIGGSPFRGVTSEAKSETKTPASSPAVVLVSIPSTESPHAPDTDSSTPGSSAETSVIRPDQSPLETPQTPQEEDASSAASVSKLLPRAATTIPKSQKMDRTETDKVTKHPGSSRFGIRAEDFITELDAWRIPKRYRRILAEYGL